MLRLHSGDASKGTRMRVRRLAWLRLLVTAVLVTSVGAVTAPASATGGTITGSVTNTAGEPQSGYLELCTPDVSSCGGYSFTNGVLNQTVTNDGTFKIRIRSTTMDDLFRYYVAGDPAGTTNPDLATVAAFPNDYAIDLVMPQIAWVHGTVLNSNDEPMAGIPVGRSRLGSSKQVDVTDVNGAYDLGYLRSGTVTIYTGSTSTHAQARQDVTVPASGDFVAPTLVMHEYATLTGTVTDSGTAEPIPFLEVSAYTRTGSIYVGSAWTDETGRFTMTQIPGGATFWVRGTDSYDGYDTGYYGDVSSVDTATDVTLADGQTLDIAFNLGSHAPADPGPHTITGLVTDPTGTPLPGVVANATSDANSSSDVTDRTGHYYIDVPDGTYTVQFLTDSAITVRLPDWMPWFQDYFGDAIRPELSTPVVVANGQVTGGIDEALVRSARIEGTVADGAGTLLTPRSVKVYGTDGNLLYDAWNNNVPKAWSLFVKPGTVRIRLAGQSAASPYTPWLPQWVGGSGASFAGATPFTLAPGQTLTGISTTTPADLVSLTTPLIQGTPKVASKLSATTGTWNLMTGPTWAYSWLRVDTKIGTGPTYTVTPADAGRSLRVRVTATDGDFSTSALSAPLTIAKLASVTTARATLPQRRTVRLAIRVAVRGIANPAGTILVKRGTTVIRKGVRLVNGRVVVLLKRQPAGRNVYRVFYTGSTQTLASSTGRVPILVH